MPINKVGADQIDIVRLIRFKDRRIRGVSGFVKRLKCLTIIATPRQSPLLRGVRFVTCANVRHEDAPAVSYHLLVVALERTVARGRRIDAGNFDLCKVDAGGRIR